MGKSGWGWATPLAFGFALLLAVSCADSKSQRLILAGGGHVPDEAVQLFGSWSGGSESKILLVTWATDSPQDSHQYWGERFSKLGFGNVEHAVHRTALAENRSQFLEQLRTAQGVFFSGGDQNYVLDTVDSDPDLGNLLLAAYHRGTVFAGTSAGTAIMSAIALTGEVKNMSTTPEVGLRPGLGILPGLIVDQHFVQRKRFGRLIAALKKSHYRLGLGVDEDGAVAIENNRFATVVGPERVIAIDSDPESREYGITELVSGDKFDLMERKPVF